MVFSVYFNQMAPGCAIGLVFGDLVTCLDRFIYTLALISYIVEVYKFEGLEAE